MVEIFVYNGDIWSKSDINKKKYGYQFGNISHRTIIFQLDLAVLKMSMHAKNKDVTAVNMYMYVYMHSHMCIIM